MINERNMVERVARAIHMASMEKPMAEAWIPETFKATKGQIEVAKAAIEAMREPTSAMLAQAGTVEADPDGRESDRAHITWWQDMIDCALWSGDTVQ